MNELVVGFDGSEQSRFALRWAADLGTVTGSRIVVVQTWSGGDPSQTDDTAKQSEEQVAAAVHRLLGEPAAGLDIEFEAQRGPTARTLIERVTSDSGLVLGSRGRGGFAGLLLGSVSREGIEYAPCPVIVIRREPKPVRPAAPILVGHDGSPSSAAALDWAVALAPSTGAEVIAVHVWKAGSSEVPPRLHERLSSEARESIELWAKEAGPTVRAVETEGDARMELIGLAERLGVSLIVVGRRGQGTVRALRIGSVASHLVTSSSDPIAIIPLTADGGVS